MLSSGTDQGAQAAAAAAIPSHSPAAYKQGDASSCLMAQTTPKLHAGSCHCIIKCYRPPIKKPFPKDLWLGNPLGEVDGQ